MRLVMFSLALLTMVASEAQAFKFAELQPVSALFSDDSECADDACVSETSCCGTSHAC